MFNRLFVRVFKNNKQIEKAVKLNSAFLNSILASL